VIEATGLKHPEQYVGGWVGDYIHVVKDTRFPLSFHFLAGLWALTSLVGRKGRLRRPGFDLYPPVSIMLLGDSGVGKSSTMNLALRGVIQPASKDRIGFFCPDSPRVTERGLIKPWEKAQQGGVDRIEGAYGFPEAKSLLGKRVGAESIMQFLIDCLDHGSKYDSTGVYGEIPLRNITISLCVCSTLDPLRESVSPGEFVDGGFVHRFLVAHEIHRPQDVVEGLVDEGALERLAVRARGLASRVPEELTISDGAIKLLNTFRQQSEDRAYDVSSLAGFWNRLSTMAAKLGMAFAISEETWEVSKAHVERAEKFLRGHIYPPLRALVLELSYDKGTRRIFKVSEDLFYSKDKGIALTEVHSRLGAGGLKQAQERLALMKDLNLVVVRGKQAFHPQFAGKSVGGEREEGD